MARTLKSDKVLFWEAVVLVCASLVMVFSASAVIQENKDGRAYEVFLRQLPWAFMGLVALFVMMRVDYHQLRRPEIIWTLLGITVIALLAVFVFPKRNGAHRWISLGGLSWQPSELAKVVAIIFSAAVLERRMHRINDIKYALTPIAIVAGGLALVIVLQPDLGTPAMLVLAVVAMIFSAGLSWRYLAGVGLLMLPVLAYFIIREPYRVGRILAFLNPDAGTLGGNYQLTQAKIAIGTGGWMGLGLGDGIQKLHFLPEPHNDFIFAVIGEELGLIGTTAVLIAFGIIAWRGLRVALLAPDRFGALLGVGFAMMVALQAFVNMSVVTGLAPTKGIPLPLISAGGSSMMMNLIAMGVLLNISQQASKAAETAVSVR
ncbi:MAG TPA: putative lipid II flippase FtsW [Vicinamibacterales bacterium]|nr:putative lipid II flippase FtsW [Vicinamibacterales bacterium]